LANRAYTLLTTLMHYAIKHGYRMDTPCASIERYPEHSRVVHLTREQLDRLYAALEAHPNREAVNAIKLLVWTGARKSEVLGARWIEFDFERGIWMRPAVRLKQNTSSTIPLNPLALKLLAEMRAASPKAEFLFPSPVEKDRARIDVRNLWAATRKATGLGLRMHDLRHVFATAALEGGVPLDAIAPLLGHSSTVMTRTYAHWSADALRVATGKAAAQLAQLPAPTIDATLNGPHATQDARAKIYAQE
jgi:integrase